MITPYNLIKINKKINTSKIHKKQTIEYTFISKITAVNNN